MNTERTTTGAWFLLVGIALTILIVLLALAGVIPASAHEGNNNQWVLWSKHNQCYTYSTFDGGDSGILKIAVKCASWVIDNGGKGDITFVMAEDSFTLAGCLPGGVCNDDGENKLTNEPYKIYLPLVVNRNPLNCSMSFVDVEVYTLIKIECRSTSGYYHVSHFVMPDSAKFYEDGSFIMVGRFPTNQ